MAVVGVLEPNKKVKEKITGEGNSINIQAVRALIVGPKSSLVCLPKGALILCKTKNTVTAIAIQI
jgi:hypothetical protein